MLTAHTIRNYLKSTQFGCRITEIIKNGAPLNAFREQLEKKAMRL